MNRITIDPVTRLEGHGKIEILLDAEGEVANAYFQIPELRGFETFHWHGETFSIPSGATRLLESAHCPNQAYALGKVFGMQCHVEMTEDMIRQWCRDGAGEIAAANSPAVQSPEAMQAGMGSKVTALNAVADRIYARWIEGLQRG